MNEEFEERRTQFNKAKDEYEYLRDKERKELSVEVDVRGGSGMPDDIWYNN